MDHAPHDTWKNNVERVARTLEQSEQTLRSGVLVGGGESSYAIQSSACAIAASLRLLLASVAHWRESPQHAHEALTASNVTRDPTVTDAMWKYDVLAVQMCELTGNQGPTAWATLSYLLKDLRGEEVVIRHDPAATHGHANWQHN